MSTNRPADAGPVSSVSTDPAVAPERRGTRIALAARSAAFVFFYFGYLIFVVGLAGRVLIWPLIHLFPSRRPRLVASWMRMQARATMRLARSFAGLRMSTRGAIPPTSCVVVMNHQSVLDIPIGLGMLEGPPPLIPTRERYRYGMPGISPLLRMARYPFVAKGSRITREEAETLGQVADMVARGERTLLIFPEGHRTRDGEIGRFKRTGLRIVFARAHRPVYCVVGDGMWGSRTVADALVRFAGTRVRLEVMGPFDPPPPGSDDETIDTFIAELRDRMAARLADLRRSGG